MQRIYLWISFFLLLIFSCTQLRKTAVQEPRVHLETVNLKTSSFSTLNLGFLFSIENPNPFGIHVRSWNYDLIVEGHPFLKGGENRVVNISADATSQVEIPLEISFPQLFDMWRSLQNVDSARYELKTVFRVELPVVGSMEIPVQKRGVFPVIRIPSVRFVGIRIKQWNFSGADVNLLVEVKNPNPFGFSLSQLNYQLQLNNLSPAVGNLNDPIHLSSHKKQTIALPLHLDFKQLGSAVLSFLRGHQSMEYKLSGGADVTADLPFLKPFHLPFQLKGNTDGLVIKK